MEFSVGQVLEKTLSTVRDRFWPMFGLMAVYYIILLAAFVAFALFIGGVAAALITSGNTPDFVSGFGGFGGFGSGIILTVIAIYLLMMYILLSQAASLNAMASPLQDINFGEAFLAGWRSGFTLLGIVILWIICVVIFALFLGLFGGIFSFGGGVSIVPAILILLMIPVLVYLVCRLALVFPVVAIERQLNPFKAIGRSWELSEGKVLTIFLIVLLYVAGVLVLDLVLFAPVDRSFLSPDTFLPSPSGGMIIYLIIAYVIFGTATALVIASMLTAIHAALAGSSDADIADTFA